jgi:dynactin 6
MSSKRASMISSSAASSALSRPISLLIDPTATIANHASISGPGTVKIRAKAVLHPQCKVISPEGGMVDVGESVVIWERAIIGSSSTVGYDDVTIVLARNVIVEATAVVEMGVEIGEGSLVEMGAKIGKGVVVGKVCLDFESDEKVRS